jgi:hypothetical protein
MIRSTKILFCENDHGCGDVTFPSIGELTDEDFIATRTTRQLREDAKKVGWSRHRGGDYCEICTEGGYRK